MKVALIFAYLANVYPFHKHTKFFQTYLIFELNPFLKNQLLLVNSLNLSFKHLKDTNRILYILYTKQYHLSSIKDTICIKMYYNLLDYITNCCYNESMNKLKELRKTTKYSQADVANLIGISRQAYCTYENGSREPDIATLIKIADFFNVSVDYVINHQREHLEVYEETKAKLIEKLKKRNISVSDLNNLNDNDLDVILRVAKQFMENKKKHE